MLVRKSKPAAAAKVYKGGKSGQATQATASDTLILSEDRKEEEKWPISEGFIEGNPCTLLRDSGLSGVIARRSLIPDKALAGRFRYIKTIDSKVQRVPTAIVHIDCPYFQGEVKAQVLQEPLFDVLVGNIEGARNPFSPNPDWKNELRKEPTKTQVEAGAETFQSKEESERGHSASVPLDVGAETFQSKEGSKKGHSDNIPIKVGAAFTRGMEQRERAAIKPLKVPSCPNVGADPNEFRASQEADPSFSKHREWATNGRTIPSNWGTESFVYKGPLLYRQLIDKEGKKTTQLLVPSSHREEVMRVGREILLGGHLGAKKTIDRVAEKFYWPGITADIKRYCASCDACQRTTPRDKVSKLPLGQMPLIDTPFQRVAVDLVGPINPPTEIGNRYILTLMDYATRYPEAIA